MNCESAFALISAHLDGQNSPEEEAALRAHLSECALCRQTLEAMRGIEANTTALTEDVPPQLKQRVMDAVAAQQKPRRSRLLGRGAALGAVAAVLALLLGTGVIRLPQRGDNTSAANQAGSAPEAVVQQTEAGGGLPAPQAQATEATVTSGYKNTAPEVESATEAAQTSDAPELEAPAMGYGSVSAAEGILDEGDASVPPRRCAPSGLTRIPAQDIAFCAELSQTVQAPVLTYYGLDEAFVQTLCELVPELGERLAEAETEQQDGRVILTLDVDTVFALHEWLVLALPRDTDDPDDSFTATQQMLDAVRRVTEFDPDFRCLTTVITLEPESLRASLPDPLPACFPDAFAEQFRAEKNWALFYPCEGFEPQRGEPACLVLLPLADAEAPTE